MEVVAGSQDYLLQISHVFCLKLREHFRCWGSIESHVHEHTIISPPWKIIIVLNVPQCAHIISSAHIATLYLCTFASEDLPKACYDKWHQHVLYAKRDPVWHIASVACSKSFWPTVHQPHRCTGTPQWHHLHDIPLMFLNCWYQDYWTTSAVRIAHLKYYYPWNSEWLTQLASSETRYNYATLGIGLKLDNEVHMDLHVNLQSSFILSSRINTSHCSSVCPVQTKTRSRHWAPRWRSMCTIFQMIKRGRRKDGCLQI